MGFSSNLRDAREAAVKLGADLKALHPGHAKQEYENVLERSRSLLTQIEQLQHAAPEAVSAALHKLRMAQGKLSRAVREERERSSSSTSSLLTGLQLSKSMPASASFQDADNLLAQALAELRSVSTGASSSSGPLSPTLGDRQHLQLPEQLQQQHQGRDEGPEQTGVLTRYMTAIGPLSSRSIATISLQPGPEGTVGSLCVVVHAPRSVQLDVYVGCKASNLKSKSMGSKKVNCMAHDRLFGITWTGHGDGTVRLHRVAESGALDYKIAEGHCVAGVAVRSMAVECHNDLSRPARCWVGDDEGRVCMLAWQDGNPQLLAQNTVLPAELHGPGPTLSAAFSMPHSKQSGSRMSSASTTLAPKGVPVLAMLCLGRTMITSGGCCRPGSSTIHRLELWDCKHMSRLREFSCTEMGAATSLELLDAAPEPQPSGALLTPGSRTQSGMESVSSWHSSLGGWEVPGGGMRLLSGHSGGQVVLWRLQGRGSSVELQELAVIGDHRENRPIKGLFAFPEWDMLVVAHSSGNRAGFSATSCLGKLSLMHLPTAAQLAEAEKRRRAAVATPHKVAQATVTLERSIIEAHAQPILSTSRLGNTIVTASTSTLRLWSPRQLAQEALKDGLAFTRVIRTASGCSILSLPEAPSPSSRPSDLTGPLESRPNSFAADTTPFAVPLDSDTLAQLHHSQQATQRGTAPLQIPQVLSGGTQGSHRQSSAQPSPGSRSSGALAMASLGKAPEGGGTATGSVAASPGSSLTPWIMRQASSHQEGSADPFAAAAAAGPLAAAAGPAPAGSGAAAAGAVAAAAAAVAGGSAATLFQLHSVPAVDPLDKQQRDTPTVGAAEDARVIASGADKATSSSRTADRDAGTAAAGAAASGGTAPPAQAPQQQAGGQQQKQRLKPQLYADAAASQTTTCAADVEADVAADLAAHCGYHFVKQLQDPPMFGSSRALQVHCNRTNRLRTVLQIPRAQLQQLDSSQQQQLIACLEETSNLHHPHTLQVHEVFVTPLHLNIVLEECSAGRLTEFASKQHSTWGPAGAETATGAAGAALSPEFARWFIQQVVLAVDYYHTYISRTSEGSTAATRSRLSVQDTVLKVVPTLPQPVVKVPTVLLARGLEAVDHVSSSSSSFDRDFIPPEALQPLHSGAARHHTPAGDVWACGVLLLKLLGGTLQQDVHSPASSPSTEAATAEQLFTFPGTSGSSDDSSLQGNAGLLELLTAMLQPQASHRCTLEQLQQHPWFVTALPPTAKTMTRRFIQLSTQTRPGQQPQDEIKVAVIAAAAAVGPQRQQQLMPAPQQKSHVQQQRGLTLLQGPASAELLATLQLQLQALKRACAQLMSISTATLQGSSAAKLTELLVTQQALAYAAKTYQDLEQALISLQGLWRLQQMHLGLKQKHRGMAVLLQSSTAEALYSVNKLLQLLRGVQEPQQWRELQHSIPAQGKRSMDSWADPAALERLGWLLQLQVYLLGHAHQALQSLWCCSEAAAAITAACTRAAGGRAGHAPAATTSIGASPSKQPTGVPAAAAAGSKQATVSNVEPSSKQPTGVPAAAAAAAGSKQQTKQALGIQTPKPHILTAVMGPSVAAQVVAGAGALLMLQLPRHTPFVLSHAVLCLYVLLLVRLNDGMLGQQQQQPLPSIARMRVDRAVEDMDYVAVSRQPLQEPPASSCAVYEGKLTPSQQQEGSEVWVVALSQLVQPDSSKGLPPERVAVRRKRQEMRLEEELRHKGKERGYLCPICQGVMQDPVYFDDGYTYCKSCIEAHILLKMKEGVESVPSPMTLQPIHDTSLKRIHNLRSDITSWLEAERARQQQEQQQQEQQQQQQRGQAVGSELDQAYDHTGLAHAAQPCSSAAARSLQQTLVKLQDAKLLSSSAAAAAGNSSSSSGRSSGRLIPPLAPIHGVCLDPPLLVLPRPAGGTLQQWISTAADSVSRTVSSSGSDFTAAWVAAMPWPLLLQLLGDVAAGVSVLHQQQPTVVHGGVHAAAVHLLQQLPDLSTLQQQVAAVAGRVCQLSLMSLLNQLAPISSCHPFLAAPETVLATGPATAAADVYGLGVLMFQLASGWLPQQYTPGTDEQIAAVCWCRDMMAQYGSTSPLAAQHQQQQAGTATAPWTPYGRHMLSSAARQLLPPGYVELMEQCLHRMPPARPCVEEFIARLQQVVVC